jgi:hypothetical protein
LDTFSTCFLSLHDFLLQIAENLDDSYKEPGELQLGSEDDSDIEPYSSNSKSRSAKKNTRKVRDEAPTSGSKKKVPDAPSVSPSDSLLG